MQAVRQVSSPRGGTEINEVVRSVIGSVLCPAASFALCVCVYVFSGREKKKKCHFVRTPARTTTS